MIRALAASLGLATVAHSLALTACIIPAAVAIVAAEVAYVIHLIRRGRTAR